MVGVAHVQLLDVIARKRQRGAHARLGRGREPERGPDILSLTPALAEVLARKRWKLRQVRQVRPGLKRSWQDLGVVLRGGGSGGGGCGEPEVFNRWPISVLEVVEVALQSTELLHSAING